MKKMTESAHEPEPAVNVVLVEEDGDVEQCELPLIGNVERDSGEFIIGERLTVQQREQLLDLLEEYKDRFAKRVGRTDIVSHKNQTERRCSIHAMNICKTR